MNVLNSDVTFWYDDENAAVILKSAAPLVLDPETGDMKDAEGNIVAKAL